MKGRKPQATALKLITGNPGKRPLNMDEPTFAPGLPEPPDCLDEAALAEWWRAGGLLAQARIVTAGDRAIFAAYCQNWSRWMHAEKQVNEFGVMVLSPRGVPVVSPWVAVASAAQSAMFKAAAELGLSPSARARLAVAPAKAANPFEDL